MSHGVPGELGSLLCLYFEWQQVRGAQAYLSSGRRRGAAYLAKGSLEVGLGGVQGSAPWLLRGQRASR